MQSEACCGGDVILFRTKHLVEPCYLGYATNCRPSIVQKAMMGRGITVMHIYGNQLKYLTLALLPLAEQSAIVSFLDRTTAAIDTAIVSARREISFLREYRTRLIADVVTGKLDVREAAATLPNEFDELESLDESAVFIDGDGQTTDMSATMEAEA